jgi:hypothetical protein
MNFNLYKPNDLENWIYQTYQKHGIHYASDLDIHRIASVLDIDLVFTKGPSQATFDNDGFCVIFINAYLSDHEKRAVFFHELCHPLMHYGDQNNMSELFKELQEIQAGHFQLYASMPIYLVQEFAGLPPAQLEEVLSEQFCLPLSLVKTRIDQIDNRIRRAQMDRRFLAATRSKNKPASQDPEVNRIMQQLYHQVNEKRVNLKEA